MKSLMVLFTIILVSYNQVSAQNINLQLGQTVNINGAQVSCGNQNISAGSCNVHGCSKCGTCNVHGCPQCSSGFYGGTCNVKGCWDGAGGGCNIHGCWNGPNGGCNVHGCSDTGICNVHGCP